MDISITEIKCLKAYVFFTEPYIYQLLKFILISMIPLKKTLLREYCWEYLKGILKLKLWLFTPTLILKVQFISPKKVISMLVQSTWLAFLISHIGFLKQWTKLSKWSMLSLGWKMLRAENVTLIILTRNKLLTLITFCGAE